MNSKYFSIRAKGRSEVVAVQLSDPFTSYTAKDFPGMTCKKKKANNHRVKLLNTPHSFHFFFLKHSSFIFTFNPFSRTRT